MKFTSPVFLATLSIAICLPGFSVIAEEQQPIIVTATKTAQTADETIAPVIVIKRKEIESNPNAAISDLLRMHAGIDIGRTGGPSQQTSVFIRGTESNHTLVLIDGVKINPGTIGTAAIQNIDIDIIERIEIVKGPRSTLYGSDAIGGVINIITRQGTEGSQYKVTAGYASFNTKTLGFAAHNKQEDQAVGITVEATESEGYAIRTTSPIKRGYDNLNIHLYGKKRIGTTDFKISHWNSSSKSEYLDFFLNPIDQDYKNTITSVDAINNISENWLSKVKISRSEDDLQQNQSNDFANTERDTLDWQHDIQISDNQLLTAGLYLSNEKTKASSFGTNFDESTKTNAVYIQDDIQLGNNHVIVGVRHTDHDTFGSHETGSIDYSLQYSDSVKIIAGVATGFRSPDSTDRFGFGGNPNLKPEKSTNAELGFRYHEKNHQFSMSYFNNNITDLIDYNDPDGFAGPISGSNKNIGKVQIDGTEASYKYTGKIWIIGLNAINQDPRDKANDSLLLRRAKQKYNASLAHQGEKHLVQLDISHVGQRKDFAVNLDAFTLLNLSGQYRLTEQISINGRIENLTDEKYALAATYRPPERSYSFNLVYDF